MDFNLYLVRDTIKKYLDCKICYEHIEGERLDCLLEAAAFISEKEPDPRRLYLLDRSAWSAPPIPAPGISYIIWDWDDGCPTPQGCSYLGLTGAFSGADLFDAVQELFLFYRKWESALYDLVARDARLKELGDRSLECFTNPICLYTSNFQNIFYSETKKTTNLMFFHPEDIYSFISYDEIEQLRFYPDFARSIDQTVPSIFPDEFFGYRILYDNIRKDGIFIARLMLCEVERPLNDSDHILLRRLAEIMRYSILRQNWVINGHPPHLDEYIRQLLDGGYMADKNLEPVFQEMGWTLTDKFFCGLIP